MQAIVNFFKNKTILIQRIKDLEKSLETVLGANGVLQDQLSKSEAKEVLLLQKVFQIAGIGEQKAPAERSASTEPINFMAAAKKGSNWASIKEKLESSSRTAYWEERQAEANAASRKAHEEAGTIEESEPLLTKSAIIEKGKELIEDAS
jgi:hypothetical protein